MDLLHREQAPGFVGLGSPCFANIRIYICPPLNHFHVFHALIP
jgi:hypothetical protein